MPRAAGRTAYPAQFRVYGNDNAKVRKFADRVAAIMRINPRVRGGNQGWGERIQRAQIAFEQDKACALGVN